ncbi:FAD-dependent oxidoreductase [Pedobacter duraquae]|uniref:Flavin-dependent monooxygenase n=1 Tax=Pedobacter duraquae TaxID=425511 RepID=A0A4R6IET5_9SPHI|nr:NAD(P)/FAD-dependent oxidoreductase [Pedobacter duraquae]TDO20820.1 2-polyprenyl-6-methoxyphenol hydroxylase-like FAD-dependent oxidoreductase [Pedobacter duraquae]
MESTINLLHHKEIAIVGAGPGGLTLARLLQLKGAKVKVYERDHSQEARVQGAIVDLHFDSGLKVLKAANLMDAFKASYIPGADNYRMLDQAGNMLLDEHIQKTTVGFDSEQFRPEIDRGVLRDLLIDALLPGTVVWDSQFVEMAEHNNRWSIKFKNGSIATADLVIGAEGYRSKIRSYVTDIEAVYSGATIIQGDIDNPEQDCAEMYALVNNANLIGMGIGKTIAVQPRANRGLTFYAASLYPENWVSTSGIDFGNADDVYNYLIKYYRGWNPLFFTLFKACKQFIPRPLDYFPLDQKWETKRNLTLIGDAAHLMPPSGEGVNTAMLDALDLSICLTNGEYADLPTAMSAFEQQMLARATTLGAEALDGIQDFAAPTQESIRKLLKLLSQDYD